MDNQTIDMQRAKHAHNKINSIKEISDTFDETKYRSQINALPATILQNGFGQAMATLLAAAGGKSSEHRVLFDHVEEWLCKMNEDSPYYNHKNDLMSNITSSPEDHYLIAQAEALAYLNWLKKFAKAYLEEVQNGDQ